MNLSIGCLRLVEFSECTQYGGGLRQEAAREIPPGGDGLDTLCGRKVHFTWASIFLGPAKLNQTEII